MKARVVVLLLITVALAPAGARADADDTLTAEARVRFNEGVRLYDRRQYEAARAAFVQAYALKKHPDVLLNLAWSNLRAGHADEAQLEFEEYLRDNKGTKRAEAERGLGEARSKTGVDTTTTTAAALPAPAPPPPVEVSAEKAAPRVARAEPIRLGALAGFSSADLNVGIGLRGGKVVAQRVWVGGELVYNFGRSVSSTVGGVTSRLSTSLFYLGPEAGYEFDLAPGFVVRPYGGIGVAVVSTSSSVNGDGSVGTSDTRAAMWPGATVLYDIPGSSFTVGADSRLVFIPGGPAFGMFATGEVRF
jgi:hypothetical protein